MRLIENICIKLNVSQNFFIAQSQQKMKMKIKSSSLSVEFKLVNTFLICMINESFSIKLHIFVFEELRFYEDFLLLKVQSQTATS